MNEVAIQLQIRRLEAFLKTLGIDFKTFVKELSLLPISSDIEPELPSSYGFWFNSAEDTLYININNELWFEYSGGGVSALVDLTDVDSTDKATGKILEVDTEGNHVYVDKPTGGATDDTELALSETYTGNLSGATTQKDANDVLDAFEGGADITTNLVSSNAITFDELNQYGTPASPRTGDITVSFTDAKLGVVQVMFHDDTELPAEISSNAKFVVSSGYYEPDTVNRISFELVDTTSTSEVILVNIQPYVV